MEGWRHLDGDEERGAPQTRHLIGRSGARNRDAAAAGSRRSARMGKARAERAARSRTALARAWRGAPALAAGAAARLQSPLLLSTARTGTNTLLCVSFSFFLSLALTQVHHWSRLSDSGGKRNNHAGALRKIPVWWRRAVLPSLVPSLGLSFWFLSGVDFRAWHQVDKNISYILLKSLSLSPKSMVDGRGQYQTTLS